MKNLLLIVGILILSKATYAQTQDSVSKKVVAYVADKFPSKRTFNAEFTQLGSYNFSSTLRGTALPDGKVSNMTQAAASANINFIQTRSWILGASFNYRFTSLTAALNEPVSGLKSSINQDFQYHASSLNLTHISKLFNKTAIYSGSITIDGSEKQFERVKGLLTTSIVLKATAKTKMTVGFLLNLDPSAQIPVFPIFTYEHHFDNGVFTDINLPRNILIRKNVFGNGRISLGTELGRTNFYLYGLDNTGKTYEFNQTDLNNGLIYEHLLWNKFILTVKGGVRISPNSRIFDRNQGFGDYIFQAKPGPAPYFNVGFSFNPFAKKRR
jgi:hypothetical protein